MPTLWKVLFVALLFCGVFGQPLSFALPTYKETVVEVDGKKIHVEIAETPEQKTQGLQHRARLGDKNGMLFIFDQPQPLSFWMKDCLIPLDILYFNNGVLVDYVDSAPPCRKAAMLCPNYPSQEPANMVLELNAGSRKQWGLNRNSKLILKAPRP